MNTAACPLCNSSAASPLYGEIEKCATCDLVRTRPTDTDDKRRLSTAYDADYFTVRNAYLARAAEFTGYFENLMRIVKQFRASGTLLDVGCGPGLLMQVAQKHKYVVSGCDVSEWAIQYAQEQGLNVKSGYLESLDYPSKTFDVVICNHTLEHVPQPKSFLVEIGRILKTQGILVVGVPNFGSLMSKLLKQRWAGLLPDQHLWHFTPKTLCAMLTACGFAVKAQIMPPNWHRHTNPIHHAALLAVDVVSALTRRSESMVIIATPNA